MIFKGQFVKGERYCWIAVISMQGQTNLTSEGEVTPTESYGG